MRLSLSHDATFSVKRMIFVTWEPRHAFSISVAECRRAQAFFVMGHHVAGQCTSWKMRADSYGLAASNLKWRTFNRDSCGSDPPGIFAQLNYDFIVPSKAVIFGASDVKAEKSQ